MYRDSLLQQYPTAEFTMIDDSTIVGKLNKKDISISVDNAYLEYKMQPDSLQKILKKYLSVSEKIFETKTGININRIIPIIKPIEYIESVNVTAKKMGASEDVNGLYEKYNDQLIIAYAEDSPNSISYLTKDNLKTLPVKEDSLLIVATENLDKLLTDIKKSGEDGVYMITAGGNYETSIILLKSIWNKENLPVDGDFVIAIPNRDILLVTGSNNKEGIKKLEKAAKQLYETGNYKVSEYLYKWSGNNFKKYN